MHRGFIAVLVLLLPFGPSIAVSAQDVPTIFLYVNDLTDPPSLFQSEFNDIQDLCFQVDDLSSAEIAILIVNTTAPMEISQYAVKVFEENRIGKEGRDNGVLLVVATDSREWRFEIGYGLEGFLPDAKVGRIGLDVLGPALADGDYYAGIYNATWEIGSEIVANYDPGGTNPYLDPVLWVLDWRAIAILAAVFIISSILTRGRSGIWLGGFFSVLRRGGFGGGRSGGGGARGKF